MVKTITHPVTGQPFRLGRNRPIARGPRFRLVNYLKVDAPVPPTKVNYAAHAGAALSEMYLNDQLGDCVIAGMAHIEGVLSGNAGNPPLTFTAAEITRLYSAIGGYVPGDPSTDQGCDEETALNYWKQHGLLPDNGEKIFAWMDVNGASENECQVAMWLFENLMFGIELPDAWINPMPSNSGFVWTAQGAGDPDPENGHCVVGVGYDQQSIAISTWGMLGHITYAATKKYATQPNGQLYTAISMDAINKASKKSPSGLDWSQLLADFDSMK